MSSRSARLGKLIPLPPTKLEVTPEMVERIRTNMERKFVRAYAKEAKKRTRMVGLAEEFESLSTRKAKLVRLHGGKCARCRKRYHPEAFDFHHLDPNTKTAQVSRLLTRDPVAAMEEAKKCIMVCASCHRMIHVEKRRGKEEGSE